MKRIFTLILASLILFSSTSCAALKTQDADTDILETDTNETSSSETNIEETTPAQPDETVTDNAEEEKTEETENNDTVNYENVEMSFVLGSPLTKESEYTDDNGVVLFKEKYELPQLEVHAADGTVCDLEKGFTSDSGSYYPPEADICRTFNAKMQEAIDTFEAAVEQDLANARDYYATLSADEQANWYSYAEELTIASTYQTNGLLSIQLNGYVSLGGVHPTSYTTVYNFDLTTGEFITLESLTGESNPLGQVLKNNLVNLVLEEINTQNLSESYFDDYYSYVNDLTSYAKISFNDSGMVIMFDTYLLAPYAAGPQMFDITYDKFYYALSEHMQSLFTLDTDNSIISDYRTTQILWSWFYMSMPPVFNEDEQITSDDGYQICRVNLGNINTLSDLKSFLCRHVSEEVADKWMTEKRFYEIDGALYTTFGARGGDITIGKTEYKVELNGNSGTLIQTVYRQDYDEATDSLALTGETEDYIYPFELQDGHAVFSDFPCPY